MAAVKISAGSYQYRGCRITQFHDSELYQGWWEVNDLNDPNDGDFFQTKRSAMAAIDQDPPEGF